MSAVRFSMAVLYIASMSSDEAGGVLCCWAAEDMTNNPITAAINEMDDKSLFIPVRSNSNKKRRGKSSKSFRQSLGFMRD